MLFPFHKCYNVLAFLTLLHLVSTSLNTSLIPPEIVNAVAPCSLTCLASFITDIFSPFACSTPPTLDCLCSRYQNAGLALGDASVTCYYTSCINQTIPPVYVIYDFCSRDIATVIATAVSSTSTATSSFSTSNSQITAQGLSSSSAPISTKLYPASIIDPGATSIGASLLTASASPSATTLQTFTSATSTQSTTSPISTLSSAATVSVLTPGQIAGVTVAAVFTTILVFFLLGSMAVYLQRRKRASKQRESSASRWRSHKQQNPGSLANHLGITGISELAAAYPKLQEAGAGTRVDPTTIGIAVSPEVTKLPSSPPRALFPMNPRNYSIEAHHGSEMFKSSVLLVPRAKSLGAHLRSPPINTQRDPLTTRPQIKVPPSSAYIPPPKLHHPGTQSIALPAPVSPHVATLYNSPYGSLISLYQSPLNISPQSKFSACRTSSNASLDGGRKSQSYIPEYYTRNLNRPTGPYSFEQSPVVTSVSERTPASLRTRAVPKMSRESSTSETSFESILSSEATPPEEENKQTIPLTLIHEPQSPLAGLRYPKIPRPSNQAIARPAPSPTKSPPGIDRSKSLLAQQISSWDLRSGIGLEATEPQIKKPSLMIATGNRGWPTRTSSRAGMSNQLRRNTREMVPTSLLWKPDLSSESI